MNFSHLSTIDSLFLIIFMSGCVGFIAAYIIGAFIWKKWMVEVVEILDDGFSVYTNGFIFGFLGILNYATVFFWSFHANRYGMLEKRKLVPKNIQRWFLFDYCLFIVSFTFFLICSVLLFFLDES